MFKSETSWTPKRVQIGNLGHLIDPKTIAIENSVDPKTIQIGNFIDTKIMQITPVLQHLCIIFVFVLYCLMLADFSVLGPLVRHNTKVVLRFSEKSNRKRSPPLSASDGGGFSFQNHIMLFVARAVDDVAS